MQWRQLLLTMPVIQRATLSLSLSLSLSGRSLLQDVIQFSYNANWMEVREPGVDYWQSTKQLQFHLFEGRINGWLMASNQCDPPHDTHLFRCHPACAPLLTNSILSNDCRTIWGPARIYGKQTGTGARKLFYLSFLNLGIDAKAFKANKHIAVVWS